MEDEKIIVLKGKASLSKAGLVVGGMIILESAVGYENLDKYVGKIVEVEGFVNKSPFPTRTKEGLPQQGFEGNCITSIKSIKIIEDETTA